MVSVQRHVALLRGELRPGEAERMWVRAHDVARKHEGALLLTDRRLLWSGLGALNQAQRAFPLAAIHALEVTDDPPRLRFEAGERERFSGRPKDLRRLADAVHEAQQRLPEEPEPPPARSGAPAPRPAPSSDPSPPSDPPSPSAPPPPSASSLVDELERLAALHRGGALTDDEFALAKRRLLGGDLAG